ncbi:MAG TPA: hypothetical protein VMJ10_11560 [Kofleriaceae bacterium]|nr:hypothetical protein [Kofleriaceae bacterium]
MAPGKDASFKPYRAPIVVDAVIATAAVAGAAMLASCPMAPGDAGLAQTGGQDLGCSGARAEAAGLGLLAVPFVVSAIYGYSIYNVGEHDAPAPAAVAANPPPLAPPSATPTCEEVRAAQMEVVRHAVVDEGRTVRVSGIVECPVTSQR